MVDCRLFNYNKFCLIGFILMLRNLFFSIIFCLALCTGLLSPAAAGQVTFEISTTTQITEDRILATVKAANRGTETAHQVSVHGFFRKEQQTALIAQQIGQDKSAQASLGFELHEGMRGAFPLYLIIN